MDSRDRTPREVALDDKYRLESGRVYLNGLQALVRLPIVQRKRDEAAGLNTAGFISGYRGSPLAGYDKLLWEASDFLERHRIRFVPGVNEELAATAVWGTQQVGLFEGALHDGVFALWYGKGPGVDRSGDALKHGNFAGAARQGGVLVLCGDDHGAKSSTLPHQSEQAMIAAAIPVFSPAGVQELLDFGLLGIAASRFSGSWIALKVLADTADSSASVDAAIDRVSVALPEGVDVPPGGLNIRIDSFSDLLALEQRVFRYRLPAVQAFARLNGVDRIAIDGPRPRIGIAAVGKAYLDVRQALDRLGIDARTAADIGLRVYKVGLSWPLDPVGAAAFARGLEHVLVVEEKRPLVEDQLRAALYDLPEAERPHIVGKRDDSGAPLLPGDGELDPIIVAHAIAHVILPAIGSPELALPAIGSPELALPAIGSLELALPAIGAPDLAGRVRAATAVEDAPADTTDLPHRAPTYCSGCPHSTSTRVPEGSRAIGGIGCHTMAVLMPERHTSTWTQMGGEGANWIGQAPFTATGHVFANLGDGTYFHSGLLAIRAAIAAKVNITYKLLYNDAVAMTGGQPIELPLTVPQITQQLHHEGVGRIVVVADDPSRYGDGAGFAPGVSVHHRDDLDRVQDELRAAPGTSVLIYDQTCAAELRRRRKRGLAPDPPVRVFINDLVCEGCGDCNDASSCVSVEPLETELGRKRTIDQSSCNKDYSCLKGYCPSFVTVHGGTLRRNNSTLDPRAQLASLSDPKLPVLHSPYGLLITGVGGTGVTTIAALLGMAAHIEGRGVTVLDQTGLAQKNGAVTSHVRFARTPDDLHTVRLADRETNALLACDLVVATSAENLATLRGDAAAAVNADVLPTAAFQTDPDANVRAAARRLLLEHRTGSATYVRASHLAAELLGDSIYANVLLLGYAWQRGLVPVGRAAIERAIELNGAAIEANKRAFSWGRLAAADPAAVEALLAPSAEQAPATTFDEIVERRAEFLERYQDRRYAERYRAFALRARAAEEALAPDDTGLAEAVARYYFKLLAYKDEYEVARLYTDGEFARKLAAQFEGDPTVRYHLAPQWRRADAATGRVAKAVFGPWMRPVLALLARAKRLRGTCFDPFGYMPERRLERRLIAEYEETITHVLAHLAPDTHSLAVEIASLPERIRGFGVIKRESAEKTAVERRRLLELFADACRRPHSETQGGRRSPSRRGETHRQRPAAARRGASTNFPLPSRRALD